MITSYPLAIIALVVVGFAIGVGIALAHRFVNLLMGEGREE